MNHSQEFPDDPAPNVADFKAYLKTILEGIGEGFYAVDQHKQIRGGPYATETEVKQKAHKDDFSYGVLRVKGKSNGKG